MAWYSESLSCEKRRVSRMAIRVSSSNLGTRLAIPPSAVPPIISSESEASLSSRIADSSPVGSQTIGQVGADRPADGGRLEAWPLRFDPCCPSG
jgi:hypothetical protein